MNDKTYIIKYRLFLTDGNSTACKTKTMIVRRCNDDHHAKEKLRDMLKKKYSYFMKMDVIFCNEEIIPFPFDNSVNFLKDIFGLWG